VGGLGTRLGPLTAQTPKPLLDVGGRPFLAWLMREFVRFGVREFVLLVGHLADEVKEAAPRIAATLPHDVKVVISEEPMRAGTGGALTHALPLLDERFWLCNGDSFLDFNLARILAAAKATPETQGWMLLRQVPDASRFGVVGLDGSHVVEFHERGEPGRTGLINGGVYLLRKDVLGGVPPVCSLERDVLPGLAQAARLQALVSDGYFIDIGIPEDLERARTELPGRLLRPALFLDRDGVINRDHGYVGGRDRFEWTSTAIDAIRLANDTGLHVFIVTNQGGVARGLYDEAAVAELHAWMVEELRAHGATIDDIRYCPYHKAAAIEGYRRASDWRKPAPGMILDLLRCWEAPPARSLLIGDQPTDVAAAQAAGVEGRLFDGGDLLRLVTSLMDERLHA
jgi:D,D-heptose 1,7-bisphosphate phosphatase